MKFVVFCVLMIWIWFVVVLWDDKTGILSPVAKNEIMGLVQGRIKQISSNPKSVTPDSLKGFANKIAIEYLQKKSVGAQKF